MNHWSEEILTSCFTPPFAPSLLSWGGEGTGVRDPVCYILYDNMGNQSGHTNRCYSDWKCFFFTCNSFTRWLHWSVIEKQRLYKIGKHQLLESTNQSVNEEATWCCLLLLSPLLFCRLVELCFSTWLLLRLQKTRGNIFTGTNEITIS